MLCFSDSINTLVFTVYIIYDCTLFQIELDMAKEMWNSHNIRPSRNHNVPSGQPHLMYHFSSLWGCSDYLMPVSDADYMGCAAEAEFRKLIPCDVDVFELCTKIMQDSRRQIPNDLQEAAGLYLYLRSEIFARL